MKTDICKIKKWMFFSHFHRYIYVYQWIIHMNKNVAGTRDMLQYIFYIYIYTCTYSRPSCHCFRLESLLRSFFTESDIFHDVIQIKFKTEIWHNKRLNMKKKCIHGPWFFLLLCLCLNYQLRKVMVFTLYTVSKGYTNALFLTLKICI